MASKALSTGAVADALRLYQSPHWQDRAKLARVLQRLEPPEREAYYRGVRQVLDAIPTEAWPYGECSGGNQDVVSS